MVKLTAIIDSILFADFQSEIMRNIFLLDVKDVFRCFIQNILVCSHEGLSLMHVHQLYICEFFAYFVVFIIFFSNNLYLFKQTFMLWLKVFYVLFVSIFFIFDPSKIVKVSFHNFFIFQCICYKVKFQHFSSYFFNIFVKRQEESKNWVKVWAGYHFYGIRVFEQVFFHN